MSKKNIKSIIGVILIIGVIAGVAGIFIKADDNRVAADTTFAVGNIDAETGRSTQDVQSICTKEAFNCQGLRVEPDFMFEGTYDVYYYDYNEHFVGVRSGLVGVYDEDYPVAKLARIVIHPAVPEDESVSTFEISAWEMLKYSNMFDIRVNKNQAWNYSANLFVADNALEGKDFASTEIGTSYLELKDSEWFNVSEAISIGNYTKFDIFVKYTENIEKYSVGIVATSGNIVTASVKDWGGDHKDNEWVKMTLEIPEDSNSDHIRVRFGNDVNVVIYGYN